MEPGREDKAGEAMRIVSSTPSSPPTPAHNWGKVTTEGYSLAIKVEETTKGFSSMQPALITHLSCAMKPRAGCSFIQRIFIEHQLFARHGG